MKKTMIILIIAAMMSVGVGCQNGKSVNAKQTKTQAQVEEVKTTENNQISAGCKIYNPKEDGIFVKGVITNIDKQKGIITINKEDTIYAVKVDDETNYVFTKLDDLKVEQEITVRADYVEEGVTELNAMEIQLENVKSNIKVTELNINEVK